MKTYNVYEFENAATAPSAMTNLNVASIVPIHFDDHGVMKKSEDFLGVYNNSTGHLCTTVSPNYNLIQHREMFTLFSQALDRLNIKYSAKIRQQGNKAFCDFSFKDRNIKYTTLKEEFTTGFRLVNSYDKTTGIGVMPRYTRLACTNGMVLSRFASNFLVRHNSKQLKEVEAFIERKLTEFVNMDDKLKTWVSESMKDSIEWQTVCKIIGKLFESVKHREGILAKFGISIIEVEDKLTKKKSISYVLDDKKSTLGNITRWEFYNAITNYISYGQHITPQLEDLFQRKAETVLLTPLAKMKV